MNTMEFHFISAGCRCNGRYFVPRRWQCPYRLPTIVIVPGGHGVLSTSKDRDCGQGLVELAKSFANDGFVACYYDGRGQGDSEGVRSGHDLAIEDLEAALAWVRTKCDPADSSRVGLFGQSLGGMAAVMIAARDDEIRSLVLWGTLPRYSEWKKKQECGSDGTFEALWEKAFKEEAWRGKSYKDFVRSFRTFDPIDFVGKLKQPILLAGGFNDTEYFKPEEQAELFEATSATRVLFVKVKDEPHRLSHWSPSFAVLARLFSAWFEETL